MITQIQQMSLTIDWIALGLSLLAIVVAVITAIAQWKSSKKINDINLAAELFKETFKDFLVEKIPNAVKQLYFPNNALSNITELQTVLNDLRKSTEFFLYIDKSFYEKLKSKCQGLEDYLVQNEDKHCSLVELGEITDTIRSFIKDIYSLLNDKYKNG